MRRKEIAMKLKVIAGMVALLLATVVVAQNPPAATPGHPSEARRSGPAMPGMDMGQFMRGPMQILGEWWKDPAVVNELRLTDVQIKQLDQISTTSKLALIDAAASGLKGFVQVQSQLEADQVNETAYNQQLDQIAAATSKLVKDIGDMALGVRRTLSTEQWRKLESLRHEHRPMMAPHPPMHPEHPVRPERPAPPPAK
jgi:hypothetical protein